MLRKCKRVLPVDFRTPKQQALDPFFKLVQTYYWCKHPWNICFYRPKPVLISIKKRNRNLVLVTVDCDHQIWSKYERKLNENKNIKSWNGPKNEREKPNLIQKACNNILCNSIWWNSVGHYAVMYTPRLWISYHFF